MPVGGGILILESEDYRELSLIGGSYPNGLQMYKQLIAVSYGKNLEKIKYIQVMIRV